MTQRSIAPQRPRYFDVPNFWVESGLIRKGGPMSKDQRDLLLRHLMNMSFEPAPPREIVTMESVAIEDKTEERV